MNTQITFLIGLDDTDNLDSCGTGFHARAIASSLHSKGIAEKSYVTRHQLLVSPLVPFTSHNSSACVRVTACPDNLPLLIAHCRDYLSENSAEGSDAGLCIAAQDSFTTALQRFGFLCKRRLVTQEDARRLAGENGIYLEGLTGTQDGVIGALAAASLHASGSDGRLLWLEGIRDLAEKTVTLSELKRTTGLADVQNLDGALLDDEAMTVCMGPWPRAVMLDGRPSLIVEPTGENPNAWRVVSKDYLKQF